MSELEAAPAAVAAVAAAAVDNPKRQEDAQDPLHGLSNCTLISQQGKAVRGIHLLAGMLVLQLDRLPSLKPSSCSCSSFSSAAVCLLYASWYPYFEMCSAEGVAVWVVLWASLHHQGELQQAPPPRALQEEGATGQQAQAGGLMHRLKQQHDNV
jgi:hypothetical protein